MFGKGTCKQKEIDNECVVACLGQCVKRESCASVENLVVVSCPMVLNWSVNELQAG